MTKVQFDQRYCTPQEREVFLAIQKAVLEAAPKTIRFAYDKGDGKIEDRHVEPYEVLGGDNAQLVAHDVEKDATRRFVLSKMSDVVLDKAFKARYPIRIML